MWTGRPTRIPTSTNTERTDVASSNSRRKGADGCSQLLHQHGADGCSQFQHQRGPSQHNRTRVVATCADRHEAKFQMQSWADSFFYDGGLCAMTFEHSQAVHVCYILCTYRPDPPNQIRCNNTLTTRTLILFFPGMTLESNTLFFTPLCT